MQGNSYNPSFILEFMEITMWSIWCDVVKEGEK